MIFLKRGNPEPILIDKIIEWRKCIDYSGLSIEANQSRVGTRTYIFSVLDIYTKPFICKAPHIKASAGQRVEFGTTKVMSVPTNKNITSELRLIYLLP